jgi:hypothetical protein
MRIFDNKYFECFPKDFMFELTKTEKDELVANYDQLAKLRYDKPDALPKKQINYEN